MSRHDRLIFLKLDTRHAACCRKGPKSSVSGLKSGVERASNMPGTSTLARRFVFLVRHENRDNLGRNALKGSPRTKHVPRGQLSGIAKGRPQCSNLKKSALVQDANFGSDLSGRGKPNGLGNWVS